MPSAVSQAPAARNSAAFVAASTSAQIGYIVLAAGVDAARSCLRSVCATATRPSTTTVAAPNQATTEIYT